MRAASWGLRRMSAQTSAMSASPERVPAVRIGAPGSQRSPHLHHLPAMEGQGSHWRRQEEERVVSLAAKAAASRWYPQYVTVGSCSNLSFTFRVLCLRLLWKEGVLSCCKRELVGLQELYLIPMGCSTDTS